MFFVRFAALHDLQRKQKLISEGTAIQTEGSFLVRTEVCAHLWLGLSFFRSPAGCESLLLWSQFCLLSDTVTAMGSSVELQAIGCSGEVRPFDLYCRYSLCRQTPEMKETTWRPEWDPSRVGVKAQCLSVLGSAV